MLSEEDRRVNKQEHGQVRSLGTGRVTDVFLFPNGRRATHLESSGREQVAEEATKKHRKSVK